MNKQELEGKIAKAINMTTDLEALLRQPWQEIQRQLLDHGWQPMDTAPKDEPFLGFWELKGIVTDFLLRGSNIFSVQITDVDDGRVITVDWIPDRNAFSQEIVVIQDQ